jgi:hypothetical protein
VANDVFANAPMVLALAMGAVGIAGVIWLSWRTKRDFAAAFAEHERYVADDGGAFVDSRIRTRPNQRFAPSLVAASTGGKHKVQLWRARVSDVRLAQRTTLRLAREGVFAGLRELLGFKDVQIGDPAFDDAYKVSGGDVDVVRAVVSAPRSRDAIAALFAVPVRVRSVELKPSGDLEVETLRNGLSPAEAIAVLDAVIALAAVLDDARDVAALPSSSTSPSTLSSVASSSGTPFALPTSTSR